MSARVSNLDVLFVLQCWAISIKSIFWFICSNLPFLGWVNIDNTLVARRLSRRNSFGFSLNDSQTKTQIVAALLWSGCYTNHKVQSASSSCERLHPKATAYCWNPKKCIFFIFFLGRNPGKLGGVYSGVIAKGWIGNGLVLGAVHKWCQPKMGVQT